MEEGSEKRKATMKNLQKEQERERRRIRDRQRRQSMSVEEREKHLARRRRNYQLRRLRAENNSRFHLHHQTKTTTSSSSSSAVAANVVDVTLTSVGLEIPSHKLAKLPTRRLRLNHLKHLARSLDNADVDLPNNHTIAAPDLIIIKQNENENAIANANANANSNCVTPKGGLRLNRVKRLARSLACDLEKSTRENEVQLELFSVSSNLSKVVDQPYLDVLLSSQVIDESYRGENSPISSSSSLG